MRRRSLLLPLAACALLLSACGGDNLDLCDGCGVRTATPTPDATATSLTPTPTPQVTASTAFAMDAIVPTPGR